MSLHNRVKTPSFFCYGIRSQLINRSFSYLSSPRGQSLPGNLGLISSKMAVRSQLLSGASGGSILQHLAALCFHFSFFRRLSIHIRQQGDPIFLERFYEKSKRSFCKPRSWYVAAHCINFIEKFRRDCCSKISCSPCFIIMFIRHP
jgi:hypothetical protein